jgi:hypothetical protein
LQSKMSIALRSAAFVMVGWSLTGSLYGQLTAAIQDLEQRAKEALTRPITPKTPDQLETKRKFLQRLLELCPNTGDPPDTHRAHGMLYVPKQLSKPAPAVLIVRPHEDPSTSEALAKELTSAGLVALVLDIRREHSREDVLSRGLTPQALMQSSIRQALRYLQSQSFADPKRIGLAGTGLVATIAAALNPELSTFVLTDGFPDLTAKLAGLHAMADAHQVDVCDLVPDFLTFGGVKQLLQLMGQRPLFGLNTSELSETAATELLSSEGETQKIYHKVHWQRTPSSVAERIHLESKWFVSDSGQPAQWFTAAAIHPEHPPEAAPQPAVPLELPIETSSSACKTASSPQPLAQVLGEPLPEARLTLALRLGTQQEVKFTVQPGIQVPSLVLRPGPQGGDAGRGVLIAISDSGRSALVADPVIQEAHRRSWLVFAIDPRGIGEPKDRQDAFVFVVSLWLGENFAWRQAWDIARIVRFAARPSPQQASGLYARGPLASLIARYVS